MKSLQDFPDFFGPVIVKELRQGVRARSFVIPFVLVQVAMILALGFDGFGSEFSEQSSRTGIPLLDLGSDLQFQSAFWTFLFPLLIFGVPFRGLQAVSSEKDDRNGELVLLTRMTRWKLIGGKWIALSALGLVTIVSSLPYLLARYFLGGMNVPLTIFMLCLLVFSNLTANAFAIGLSGFSVGKRLALALFGVPVMMICVGIGAGGAGLVAAQIVSSGEFDILSVLIMTFGLFSVTLFLVLSWLQVGRAKLRLFEDPLLGPASSSMLTLFFCSPVILGAAGALTIGWGIIPAFFFMSFVVSQVDPAPKKTKAVPYAGAYSH
ncbi:MAG: ABC transporter permease subunit [Verrucomicrobiota bacterium]